MGVKIFKYLFGREQTMKNLSDLNNIHNSEISMNKNLTFPLLLKKVIRKDNSIKFPNLITRSIELVREKWSTYLNIQPHQEIEIVMLCILFIRYTAVSIVILLAVKESIDLIEHYSLLAYFLKP